MKYYTGCCCSHVTTTRHVYARYYQKEIVLLMLLMLTLLLKVSFRISTNSRTTFHVDAWSSTVVLVVLDPLIRRSQQRRKQQRLGWFNEMWLIQRNVIQEYPIHTSRTRLCETKGIGNMNTGTAHDYEQSNDSTPTTGSITDWVIENLETDPIKTDTDTDTNTDDDSGRITSRSSIRAGENDTLPSSGLCIGTVRILAMDATAPSVDDNEDHDNDDNDDDTFHEGNGDHQVKQYKPIRLYVGRNGWGTGVHPTTRLCLEWICDNVRPNTTIIDYGCGSGILSIAALHMGATKVYGVDVEAESLITAVRNVQYNGYNTHQDGPNQQQQFVPLHTRQVLPYGIHPATSSDNDSSSTDGGGGVDISIANILIGQLIRPSMVAAIMTNIKSNGGIICFSGIRPGDQVTTIKRIYNEYGGGAGAGGNGNNNNSCIEWITDDYKELAAIDTPYSIESYGFDCGTWCRVIGRRRRVTSSEQQQERRENEIRSMSDAAVS